MDRVAEGTWPRYAAGNHLILSRGTTLLAAPFDPTRLELTGPAVPIVEGVAVERTSGGVHAAVSSVGTLAYVPAAETYALVLVEANGSERLYYRSGTRLMAARIDTASGVRVLSRRLTSSERGQGLGRSAA